MARFLFRRLLTSLLVLLGVSVFTFLMLHLVPGDPVHALAGKMISSPEKLEELAPSRAIPGLSGQDTAR